MQNDMKDEQRSGPPEQPGAERKLSDYQHQAGQFARENGMLRAVLDSMSDSIAIKDLKGRYVFDNRSHCRFLGAMKTADVVGKTLFDFLPAAIAAKFHADDLCVLRSGEAVVRSADEAIDTAGNKIWLSVTKVPLHDDQGELIGLVSTTHDITARKKAEEQLLFGDH